jgi:hypothetical protein
MSNSSATHRNSYSPQELKTRYQKRLEQVADLSRKGSVTATELLALDRLSRLKVANELWNICDQSARDALLDDEHAHVRSCARLAG